VSWGTQITADRTPITADRPLGLASGTEAVPYTPKVVAVGNGFGTCPVHGMVSRTE
jgi:hypothetical protein